MTRKKSGLRLSSDIWRNYINHAVGYSRYYIYIDTSYHSRNRSNTGKFSVASGSQLHIDK